VSVLGNRIIRIAGFEKLVAGSYKRIIVQKIFANFPNCSDFEINELGYIRGSVGISQLFQQDGWTAVSLLVNVGQGQLRII